jgi:hypothetical protein
MLEKNNSEESEEIEESDEAKEDPEESEEEATPIDDSEFHQFMDITLEKTAPVLERIATAQNVAQIPEIEETPPSEIQEEAPRYTALNEPDYGEEMKYETTVEPPVLRPMRSFKETPRTQLLDPMAERGIRSENTELEKIRTDMIERDQTLPMEGEDKKYKEFKLRRFD